jgi:glucosylceramidase
VESYVSTMYGVELIRTGTSLRSLILSIVFLFSLDSQGGPNHLGNLCDSSLLAVPHRAKNAPKDFPHLLEWEKTNATAVFGANVGDGRTLPELNALGFPAAYLELGVVVQPMYYYMGHISRYVRPGSRAVMGLVDQADTEDGSLTFRPKGQTVAGGGINDLAQPDVELTVWPCEGSTRQSFRWDVETRQLQVYGHDWVGKPTTSCVSNYPHPALKGVVLVPCDGMNNAATLDVVKYENYTNFRLTNGKHTGKCLAIVALENNGGAYGPRGGAQIALGGCSSDEARFLYNEDTSEITSMFYEDVDDNANKVCMTTGWPFLQIGAFDTPNGEAHKTVVILNEASDAANYAIKDNGKVLITGSIPPRTIHTLLIN